MWSPAVGASVGSYTLKEVVARGSAASIWRATLADQAVGIEAVAVAVAVVLASVPRVVFGQ